MLDNQHFHSRFSNLVSHALNPTILTLSHHQGEGQVLPILQTILGLREREREQEIIFVSLRFVSKAFDINQVDLPRCVH